MEDKSAKNNLDLSIKLCGITFKNPLVLASGILGDTVSTLKQAIEAGVGGVVSKSCNLSGKEGYPKPWLVKVGEFGYLNAVGLKNPGVEEEVKKLRKLRKLTRKEKPVIIASIFAPTIADFGITAEKISKACPDFIELNISCPHVDKSVKGTFYNNPQAAEKLTKEVKKRTKIPIIVKLSPNAENIVEVAKAVEEGGADLISAINTLGPGMAIDIKTGRAVLGNKIGGLSGPAIKPIAIRCVYQICQNVRLPVIGMGGITTGEEAIEMFMAGAAAIGVGTAFFLRGSKVVSEILLGVKKFMKEKGYTQIEDFKGLACKV